MKVQQSFLDYQRKIYTTAYLLLKAGKLDDAITLYDYLLILNPFAPQYWIAGGWAKMRKGYLDEAFASFQVAEAGDETNPIPVMMRGICQMRMKDSVGGLIALKKAKLMAQGSEKWKWLSPFIDRYVNVNSKANDNERSRGCI